MSDFQMEVMRAMKFYVISEEIGLPYPILFKKKLEPVHRALLKWLEDEDGLEKDNFAMLKIMEEVH
jgi:hypothetical protein